MGAFYWERHPDGPFATLISVATSWLHPEIDDLDGLERFAKRDDIDEVRVFKSELRRALRDPALLPGDELSEFVQYDNGSDEAFLCWLWHELYGDEPSGASILTRLTALPEPYADRSPSPAGRVPHRRGAARRSAYGRVLRQRPDRPGYAAAMTRSRIAVPEEAAEDDGHQHRHVIFQPELVVRQSTRAYDPAVQS
jgi:hypothetical protein